MNNRRATRDFEFPHPTIVIIALDTNAHHERCNELKYIVSRHSFGAYDAVTMSWIFIIE